MTALFCDNYTYICWLVPHCHDRSFLGKRIMGLSPAWVEDFFFICISQSGKITLLLTKVWCICLNLWPASMVAWHFVWSSQADWSIKISNNITLKNNFNWTKNVTKVIFLSVAEFWFTVLYITTTRNGATRAPYLPLLWPVR